MSCDVHIDDVDVECDEMKDSSASDTEEAEDEDGHGDDVDIGYDDEIRAGLDGVYC